MNWDAISAISDTLAALAVVATLVYLAIQIRQNTSAIRSTTTHAAHDQAAMFYDLMASDSQLGEIFSRGLHDPDALNSGETARFYAAMSSATFRSQNWYFQARSGLMDRELLESWNRVLRQVSGMPGHQRFWEERRHVYAPEYVTYLEQEVFLSERDPNYRPLGVDSRSKDHARS